MGFGSFRSMMINWTQPQIALGGTEGIFSLCKLDIELPYLFGIPAISVGPKQIAAACLKHPISAMFVFSDRDSEPGTLLILSLLHLDFKE